VLIIRRSKLYYTASGIITGRPPTGVMIQDTKIYFWNKTLYFVIPYCRAGFVQFFFGVPLLICFLCLFGIEEFDVQVTVHRDKFL